MIRFAIKIATWLGVALVLLLVVLLTPVAYNELACTADPQEQSYQPIVTEAAWHRAESRSFLTYPEWHIVHAYDDYAKVITEGDPHDFGYFRAIRGFWGSLCALTEVSAQHGGFDSETKQTIYTIGVSFSLELAAKALYEETLGRLATLLRGEARSKADDASALQARYYADFLQQVPWYKWNFQADKIAVRNASEGSLRDTERRIALGLEYGVKAGYASMIEKAVASIGGDKLRLRLVLKHAVKQNIADLPGVDFIAQRGDAMVFETPRYRELTKLLKQMASHGATFVEIAGNDEIMLTAIAPKDSEAEALFAFDRQGYGDKRLLVKLPVEELGIYLRRTSFHESEIQVEHIHDY